MTTYVAFQVIKATIGLRVSAEEELQGLDQYEHGISAYYDLHARERKQYLAAAFAGSGQHALAGLRTSLNATINMKIVFSR